MTDTPKSGEPTMAMQGEVSQGTAVVGIWNLHVRITFENKQWFAQAYEIDYAACGSSFDDVKQRFQAGLAATVHEHLVVFGTIKNLLSPSPADVWQDLQKVPGAEQHTYSQVGVHELFPDQDLQAAFPFDGIEYRSPELARATC